jgi:hypothetical protein
MPWPRRKDVDGRDGPAMTEIGTLSKQKGCAIARAALVSSERA